MELKQRNMLLYGKITEYHDLPKPVICGTGFAARIAYQQRICLDLSVEQLSATKISGANAIRRLTNT
jgi:hypothetical protein